MDIKRGFIVIYLLILAIVSTMAVQNYIFRSHLRHGIVEDGSVSQFAGDILDSRSVREKYSAILESDGKANGRYRPAYFLYETLPFIITTIKNGDYHIGEHPSKIRKVLNGDLRVHMIFLTVTISVAIFFGSIMIWKLSGSITFASLFPFAVIFSPTLVRNITYNDTAEVPQLLWFTVYLVLFFWGEKSTEVGRNTKMWISSVTMVLVAILLYFTKETSIVLFPTLVIYISLYYIFFRLIKGEEIKGKLVSFHILQLAVNCLLTLWVLYQVNELKGGYSDNYKVISMDQLWGSFLKYKNILISYPATVYIPLTSIVILCFVLIVIKKNIHGNETFLKLLKVLLSSVLFISLGSGLLIINLPWEFVGARYMLPVAYFYSIVGCLCLGSTMRLFKNDGLNIFAQAIVLTILVWICYPSAISETERIAQSYDIEFGAHDCIDNITDQIISNARQKGMEYYVMLDTGNMSYWFWIQAARIINLEGKINVEVPNHKYPQERLYLRKYPDQTKVIIVPSDGDGYRSQVFDRIYSSVSMLVNDRLEKIDRLRTLNREYRLEKKQPVWVNGRNQYEIYNYSRI